MPEIDFTGRIHTATRRDYLARVNSADKAACAEVASRFEEDYWDGDRKFGYGGYRYDGRWRPVAEAMVKHYGLDPDASILDVGCGKGFLLHEFGQILPHAEVVGLDISRHALRHAKEEVRQGLSRGTASRLPFRDGSFDLVVSVTTLHNLPLPELWDALREIQRVGRGASHLTVEAFRDEREKVNLLYWQLTCKSFYSPSDWEWLFVKSGYTGDWGFIYFV